MPSATFRTPTIIPSSNNINSGLGDGYTFRIISIQEVMNRVKRESGGGGSGNEVGGSSRPSDRKCVGKKQKALMNHGHLIS